MADPLAGRAVASAEVVQRVLAVVDALDKPSDLTRHLAERKLRIRLPGRDEINSFSAPTVEGWNYYARGGFEGAVRWLEVTIAGPSGSGPHQRCTVDLRNVVPRLRARDFEIRRRQAENGRMHAGRIQATRGEMSVEIGYYRTYRRVPSDVECLHSIQIDTREPARWRLDAGILKERLVELASVVDRRDALDQATVEAVLGIRLERNPLADTVAARGVTTQGWRFSVFFDPSDAYGHVSARIWMEHGADPQVDGIDECTLPLASMRAALTGLGFEGRRQGLPLSPRFLRFHDDQRKGVSVTLEDYPPDPEHDNATTCLSSFEVEAWDPDEQG